MKVMSVIHFPEYGGPHNQSCQLSGPLRDRGVDSFTVLPFGVGADRIEASGGNVRRLELGRFRASKSVRLQSQMLGRIPIDIAQLRAIIAEESPDIVQLNGLMNPHAAIAARSLGVPVVWQLLDTRPPVRVRKVMAPIVNSLADVVMPVGEAVADAHLDIDPKRSRSVVFYPPVNTELFRPANTSTLRRELSISESAPIVGCVANVNPQKGYETFVEAAGLIHRQIPEAVFVSAGHIYRNHQEYRHRLSQRAEEFGLTEGRNLFFLDSRSDLRTSFRLLTYSSSRLSQILRERLPPYWRPCRSDSPLLRRTLPPFQRSSLRTRMDSS